MKDQWEQESASLKAEVAALRQQVHELLAAQPARANPPAHRRVSKSLKLLPSVCLVLAASGVLYGQGAIDALFIDQQGRVGIGKTDPTAALDVAGNVNVAGPLTAATLNVTTTANLSNTTIKGMLTTDAKVGIGTPKPENTLDVRGGAHVQSLAFTDREGKPYPDNWIGMADNILEDKTKWLHIGGITDGADAKKQRRIALYANTTYIDGNVGIWTKDPKAKLDVNGDIKATSVNGEKLPMIFEVGQKNDTTNWHHVEQDIGPLCGDADGCTMKFLLRHSLTDEVRTIAEQIYIEQPDKSNNKEAGLRGWARQLGGGDSSFILQTPNKYEIVPHPWEWIWVLNYSHGNVGRESKAYEGYNVQFLTHPHVTATVIIYDR